MNVELQVLAASHELVRVHVTVLEPPQKFGAVAVVFERELLHPPLFDAWLSHVAYAAAT